MLKPELEYFGTKKTIHMSWSSPRIKASLGEVDLYEYYWKY